MKSDILKTALAAFVFIITIDIYAQGPPGGGQMGTRGPGSGQGQQPRPRPNASQILTMLDTNDDGKISKEEASKAKKGKLLEDFDKIDTNEDGFLGLEELEAFFNHKKVKKVSPEKLIKKADKNDDGELSREELDTKRNAHLLKHFKAIDTDKNDMLSLEELEAFFLKEQSKRPKKRPQ
ncbi:EF-hand domain-containing protein [Cognatitamlana onchidii]|uniref:EF-hand domain-containing protein n=1 Tax=Cognatitamlana onchidii TaxID=2562860 RepID=UPI0010A5F262|nr:EF-hand domain-containing protein [Algibacter onchidii]